VRICPFLGGYSHGTKRGTSVTAQRLAPLNRNCAYSSEGSRRPNFARTLWPPDGLVDPHGFRLLSGIAERIEQAISQAIFAQLAAEEFDELVLSRRAGAMQFCSIYRPSCKVVQRDWPSPHRHR